MSNELTAAAPPLEKRSPERVFPTLARVLVGFVIIAVLAWRTNFTELLEALRGVSLLWLVMVFAVETIAHLIWASRWKTVLDIFEISVPLWRLVRAIYIGFFFNNFLPTSMGGDLYRGYWILDDKSQYRKSLFIIFVERFIGFVLLGYLSFPAFFLFVTHDTELGNNLVPLIGFAALLCVGMSLLHPAVFGFFNRWIFRDHTLICSFREKIGNALLALHTAGPRKWRFYGLSLGVQLAGIATYFCIGQALGLTIPIWHYFVIVPFTVVASLLPISFNGLGLREGALVFITSAMGAMILPSEAIAMGLLFFAFNLINSLIGGVFYVGGKVEGAVH